MSHKLRAKIEQQPQRKVQLPPMEPMTPALVGAKQVLWDGDELLQKATDDVHSTLNSGLNQVKTTATATAASKGMKGTTTAAGTATATTTTTTSTIEAGTAMTPSSLSEGPGRAW
jgi:hypothetical protein